MHATYAIHCKTHEFPIGTESAALTTTYSERCSSKPK